MLDEVIYRLRLPTNINSKDLLIELK